MRSRLGAVTAASAMAMGMVAIAPVAVAADDDPIEAGITVPKVEGMGDNFINGADFSSILSLEESGVIFRDDSGAEADLFEVLADHGVNYARIRVWNSPFDDDGNGYGAGNVDATRATEIGKRATDAGMKVLVDFHYSDFWAHPGQQVAPRDWAGLTLEDRATALYDYTAQTLQDMDDAGVDVGMVQIGNETTGGQIAGTSGWDNTAQLFQAGSEAVRDTLSSDVKVAVHFTNPERAGQYATVAKALDDRNVDYDVFASSYYPFWHGTLDNLTSVLDQIATTYDKEVVVAETSWNYTLEDGDGTTNVIKASNASSAYSSSVQGQALAVRDVMQAVAKVSDGKGLGTFYWEPAWLPVGPPSDYDSNWEKWEEFGSGWATSYAEHFYDPNDEVEGPADAYGGSGWDNQALFDFNGYPLESLNVYEYARTGSVGPREFDSVVAPLITVTDGDTVTLPSAVDVRYTDGVTEYQDVTWSASTAWITGPGVYAIKGTTTADIAVTASITVLEAGSSGENFVLNPGFESGVEPWTGTGSGYTISANDDPFEGSKSTHFYSSNAFSFGLQQVITGVPAGTYRLSAKMQGDGGTTGVISIAAASGISTVNAPATLDGYLNWQTPTTELLNVGADGVVTISASFNLPAASWGTIDNFALVADSETVTADTSALEALAAEADAIDREGYTVSSVAALDKGERRAQFVFDSPAPSKAAVDAAWTQLRGAIDGLTTGEATVPDPTVHPAVVESVEGDEIVLPGTVTVEAFDESTTTESVIWNDVLDLITSPGTYVVHGVSQNGWAATATVTVTARNWILNGGFESGVDDVTPWQIIADPWPANADTGTLWVMDTGDAFGSFALNMWSDAATGEPFEFSATQEVNGLAPGVYRLSAGLMGADEGEASAAVELVANPGDAELTVPMELLGWGNWSTPSVDAVVGDNGILTVQVRGDWGVGDWGWVDQVSLIRVADASGVDAATLEDAISTAGAIDREAFTAESVASLDVAVNRGQIVLAASGRTQQQVDDATVAITTALGALVEATDPEDGTDPDDGTGTDPDDGTDGGTGTDPDDGSGTGGDSGADGDAGAGGGADSGTDEDSDSTPSAGATFHVPFTSVVPGQTFDLTLTGLTGDEVEVGIASTYQQLATAQVVNGEATVTVTIPMNLEPGVHHLQAYDDANSLIAEYEITVVAAADDTADAPVSTDDDALSTTGTDAAVMVAIALALLAAGLLITRHSRRRTN
ncbi:glycosyl hydrolase 53 family protein [Demequina oxidasica]|uniref:glycosyl hydrolase 53 family protein n=1 Tax=Demequina oxidasica TaxID=676199 RepID=UPI0007806053|nr:glycosyl hydrolase 53 family protein [Demequina oxidasica]